MSSSGSAISSTMLPMDDDGALEEFEGLVRMSSVDMKNSSSRDEKKYESKRRNHHWIMSKLYSRNRIFLLIAIFFVFVILWRMIRVDETAEVIEQIIVEVGEEETKNFTESSFVSPSLTLHSESSKLTNPIKDGEDKVDEKRQQHQEDVEIDQHPSTTREDDVEEETSTTTPTTSKTDVVEENEDKETTNTEQGKKDNFDNESSNDMKVQQSKPEDDKEEVDDGGWGHWKFYDGGADDRPESEDYMLKYPNNDVPADEFPENAWQTDAVYVNHFIDEAMSLISRAKEAILTEYGYGLPRTPEQSVEAEQMFKIHTLNLTAGETEKDNATGWNTAGGWTTKRSFDGLSRRLLHAMMTHGTFTFINGGHSIAAAHGNHFHQSYMMQFHKIMEPIFERLGMTLVTRNMGQGGFGTMHNVLGSKSIYGTDLDMVLWDSKLTERNAYEADIFMRQVLLAGNRVPFVMCKGCNSDVMKHLHEEGMADIGMLGDGMRGIPEVESEIQANDIVWAAQYMKCSLEASKLCGKNKYNSTCWIDRDDVTPLKTQREYGRGRTSWHPGWRYHQLQGRVLAMWVLDALWDALQMWQDITIVEGNPLSDEHWHVTEYYNNIQDVVANQMSDGPCEEKAEEKKYPKRICRLTMDGRSEHTPRANFYTSSIRSILKPPPDKEKYMPQLPDIQYEGEDVPIPAMQLPEGEIDVRKIVSARRKLQPQETKSSLSKKIGNANRKLAASSNVNGEEVALVSEPKYGRQPGKGWAMESFYSGLCDGTYYSTTCGREPTNDCLLLGRNDQRGVVMGDGMAGWLLLDLGIVKNGIIMLHIDLSQGFSGTEFSRHWSEPNDGEYERKLRKVVTDEQQLYHENSRSITFLQQEDDSSIYEEERVYSQYLYDDDENHVNSRILKGKLELHEDFIFEAAINDKIVIKYNKTEYMQNERNYQTFFQVQIILDDEQWEEQEVELGIRVSGCKRDEGNAKCSIGIGHVYWA